MGKTHLNIGNLQLEILRYARSFLQAEDKNASISNSVLLYLNSWDSQSLGNTYLRYRMLKQLHFIEFFIKLGKACFAMQHYVDLSLYESSVTDPKKHYDVLIVSWCKKSDFAENGNYKDRYFNSVARDHPNVLWLLVSLDNDFPEMLESNIKILTNNKQIFLKRLFLLSKFLLKKLISVKAVPKLLLHMLSAESLLAEKIAKVVDQMHTKYAFRSVLQPYEAQPFQHAIYQKLSLFGVHTVGYLHSALPPLPTDLIYREGAPQIIYVHGKAQITIMQNLLYWQPEQLRLTQSLRYKRYLADSFSGWIFLPYNFTDGKKILEALGHYFMNQTPNSLPSLKPRCHPAKMRSQKHVALMEGIAVLISNYEALFTDQSDRKLSVFVGATAAIIEALERNVEVLHITVDPVMESHQHDVWEGIEVTSISENVYTYQLREKGKHIWLGEDDREMTDLISEIIKLGQKD